MGQKTNPIGLRLGIIRTWDSNWIASKKEYAKFLHEDLYIRNYIHKKAANAEIGRIIIERPFAQRIDITVHTGKPGLLIGRQGRNIQEMREHIEKKFGRAVKIETKEIKDVELNAYLVARNIALQLEKRASFRRAMKTAVARAMQKGAVGAKVIISGRIGGAEIARHEQYSEGKVPLHTLRANIDYGIAEALTTYGKIGVKVWINLGEVDIKAKKKEQGGN